MKTLRFTRILALGSVLVLTACSPPPAMLKADGVERVSVDRSAVTGELSAFRASALKLGDALLRDGGAGNVIASPGSLLIALAMLRAGASGEAAAEMDAVLGLPAANRDEAMNALLASLEQFDGDPGSVDESNPPLKPLMHAANGLFVDKNTATGEAYLQTLAQQYGSGVYPVDFRDEATTSPAIDAWVDKNTGGRIKKAPAAFDPDNTFSVLNAVYFAGAWKTPFSANATSEAPFTKAGGVKVNVPMMHGLQDMSYAEGAGWQAVDLPFGEGFVMRLVLPEAGTDAVDGFGPEKLAKIAEALGAAGTESVQLALPTWDHQSNFDLREVLGALGLRRTLATSQDFNAIQHGMRITQAAQAANITVAEKGTIAAAVTQINAEAVSGRVVVSQRTISFDRPFQYQIVHVETGLPLFMGKVADPR
ncbi:serpin family protein [Arthrobacter sp. ISL-48]|uniref:serpin family protein n=1 Tax=Arthrobacter sp. ISL-48 TaxID=2819110 RepID=UPI001BE79C63|nr:serpin family protein [Arthrobacter sp. ISL-48]MBT2531228.1 serpin family protein [Arthrobacter sp. ISL-48]